MTKSKKISLWIASLLAAFIMLQTLFFKFSGAAESIYIFTTLGIEPWGRIGSGIVELIASVLLLIPKYRWIGALIGWGTIAGALFSHLTVLGIEIMNDGGQLFLYALLVFVCCTFVLFTERNKFLVFFKK